MKSLAHPRFYCSQLPHPRLSDAHCLLDPDETRHARKVLRLAVGDSVELFDGRGGLASATIEGFKGGSTRCHVTAMQTVNPDKPSVILATAMPKGPCTDQMIRQLSQVGADRVIPLQCEYGVVQPRASKLERLTRQAMESAKQSKRLFFMKIDLPQRFVEVLSEPYDLGLIAVPGGMVDHAVDSSLRGARRVLLLIGPEGGWSPQELELAEQAGLIPWTIGPHVMRIETAGPMAVALVRYLCGGRLEA